MTQAFTVVIPARYASTRLPGKPLQDIAGQPMIQRVWNQARKSAANRVVVATDDERILAACQGFGAEALLHRRQPVAAYPLPVFLRHRHAMQQARAGQWMPRAQRAQKSGFSR